MEVKSLVKDAPLKPNIKLKSFIIALLVGIIICLIPRPAAIPVKGWYLLAVFVSILLASALGALSIGLASFIGIFVHIASYIGSKFRTDTLLSNTGKCVFCGRLC